MANTTTSTIANTQLYNDYVLKGFVQTIAPLRAFSFDASPAPAAKGQTVNMTFVPSASAASTWTEGSGYTMLNATRTAISVTMNNHKFVGTYLTDIEQANSALVRLEDQGLQNGRALALAVLQDIVSSVTGSNFAWGHNFASSSTVSVDGLVDLRKKASTLAWGTTRNVVLAPNAFGYLLKDDDLKYIYRGENNTVTQGVVSNVFGWNNVYEANGYPTTLVSGSNTQIGFAATPDALAVAVRYLQPAPESQGIVEAYPLTDPASGITIGFRKWYDANSGQVRSVYECVWGKAVGNPSAAINITATVDA